MKKLILSICLLCVLSFSASTYAQDNRTPEKMIEEGAEMIFSALTLILKTIPQYQPPKLLDNGDIIIRRVRPEKQSPDDNPEETQI